MLTLDYDCSAHLVLTDPEFSKKAAWMRACGVQTLWLFGYFYGAWESDPEEMRKAKKVLEEEGFTVHVIHVPLGHGGNALDPDGDVRLTTGAGWRLRCDAQGQVLPNTTCCCVDKTVADFREANQIVREMGVDRIFYDDDFRLGRWGADLQGCYCDDCMERFCKEFGAQVTRAQIAESAAGSPLQEAWMDFQCRNLTEFLKRITLPGQTPGIMLMHNGDRRHGLDVAMLRRAVPEAFYRVGEAHFDDNSFLHPDGEKAIAACVRKQMLLAGGPDNCYSESTVFPMNTLSPENWVRKMHLEISLGLRKLFLMSGTVFFPEEYWKTLAKELPALREQAAICDAQDAYVWHL